MSAGYLVSAKGVSGDFSPRIDALFAEWDRDRSPGAVLAVCHRGEVIHQRGYGVANVEDDIPFTAETVLRLGSTTKHLCATCILILENRGEISLGDDIRRFVPELPEFAAAITLRHLLTMTSGLWDGLNLLLFAGLDTGVALKREQLLQLDCAQRQLMFRPGDGWSYSNTNYSLLSLVIERVSGTSLSEFMQKELFAPLGMTQTSLTRHMARTVPGKARGYQPQGENRFAAAHMMIEMDGAGGVDTSVADMLKWFANYRDDRHFGPRYRQRLEAESRLNDGRLLDYRFGIEVKDYRGMPVVRHAGGMPGYLSDFVFFPRADLGIILLTNLFEPSMLQLPDKIADIVLQGKFDRPLATTFIASDRDEIKPLFGVYASVGDGLLVELADDGGKLVAYVLGEPNVLYGKDGWLQSGKNPIALRPMTGAAGQSLELRLGCEAPRRLLRTEDPRTKPAEAPGDLDEFVGRYVCDEIAEQHETYLRDNALHVQIASPLRNLVWDELARVGGDFFVALIGGEPSCTNVAVRFLRDRHGAVAGLSYSINRCHDVRFHKRSENGSDT